jgi:potassium/chloride transporter 4/5/6
LRFLSTGKGLTLVSGVLEGEYSQRKDDVEIARHNIMEVMKRERAKGFSDVIVSRNVGDGINYL